MDVHPVVGLVNLDHPLSQEDLVLSKREVSTAFLQSVSSLADPKACR